MTITADAFRFVAELVRAESAIVLEAGKEYLVESRLAPLARAAGVADVNAYVAEVASRRTPAALRSIVEALTTNETSWFRDSEPFNTLRNTVFPALAAERRGRMVAVVTTAVPLSDQQKQRLGAALATLYGRQVHLNLDVDPEVRGGVSVRIGDEIVDGTVATRLEEAARRLAG